MSDLRSLVISSNSQPQPVKYKWKELEMMTTFAREIITQDTGEDDGSSAHLGNVISGMPTVFARANMFKIALDSVNDPAQKNKGLIAFYEGLIDEWRGLIACIALNNEKITVKRVDLKYPEENTIDSNENIYHVAGSFGNMLFDRKMRWSDPEKDNPSPFIDVILYDNKVIGGTSPDSLFFTSASYNLSGSTASYIKKLKVGDNEIGYFTDPVKLKGFDPNDLHRLRSYVKHIKNNVDTLTKFYSSHNVIEPSHHNNLNKNLQSWLHDMDVALKEKGVKERADEIPQITKFHKPFDKVINYSTTILAKDGIIYEEGVEGGIAFDPQELLLPNDTKIACIDDEGKINFLEGKPILLLKAGVKATSNEFRHFLLPITPKGIQVFGDSLSTILGLDDNTSAGSRIIGTYDPESEKLSIEMKLMSINNTPLGSPVKVEYNTTSDDISGDDILLWPNFVSPKWNKYYIFSEMPHNAPSWKAIPFCMDSDNKVMYDDQSNDLIYVAKDGKETNSDQVKFLIHTDTSKLGGNKYKYEILESKNPYKGFKFLNGNNLSGYAVIEYGKDTNSPIKLDTSIGDLGEAYVGVDFGSTNSAVAYRAGNEKPQGYQFTNRRVSLFAPEGDEKDNTKKPAVEDEVFFFQNDEIMSNEIKSVLSIHDNTRIFDDKGHGNLAALSRENVKGGFPCFEKNLPIEDSDHKRHLLKFNSIGQSQLIHNMKWDSDANGNDIEKSYRAAYLKNLFLHVYADLFEKGLYPKELKWAFPSAMGKNLIGSYNQIWQELGSDEVNPLNGNYNVKVSEAFADMSDSLNTSGDNWGSGTTETKNNDSWGSSNNDSFDSNSDSGWGTDETKAKPEKTSGGWDDNSGPKIVGGEKIDYTDNAIEFDFGSVDFNKAMTESEAVANFMVNADKVETQKADALTIVFDIGGSTTDILVLGRMNGPKGPGISMIKQSSIRFAAKRISDATKYSKNFKNVLVELLEKRGIKVEGINKGENKYSENTAPYYFEQLVDRLEGDDFDFFYKKLGTDCKEMCSVNLYVTGLIIFYAGQIAKKVKMEIDKSPNKTNGWKNPKVQIQFTGKGSRIMDWLKSINPAFSDQYYDQMFIRGFGGMEEAKKHLGGPPVFQNRDSELLKEVKYEVAKGLASNSTKDIYVPKQEDLPLEVMGEDGFVLFTNEGEKKLSPDDAIKPSYLKSIGNAFMFQPENPEIPCPRFMDFAQLYYKVATDLFDFKATKQDFMDGFKLMNISDYITLMPEFQEASRNEKGFDFVAPIIVLEGMKFFEEIILKKL
tara:strand:+ start:7994 stop:11830 length:3837 start_codon:yes stop_codon:yes gene_type:complete